MRFIFGRIRAQDTNVGQDFADPDAATANLTASSQSVLNKAN